MTFIYLLWEILQVTINIEKIILRSNSFLNVIQLSLFWRGNRQKLVVCECLGWQCSILLFFIWSQIRSSFLFHCFLKSVDDGRHQWSRNCFNRLDHIRLFVRFMLLDHKFCVVICGHCLSYFIWQLQCLPFDLRFWLPIWFLQYFPIKYYDVQRKSLS
jgi:hypothetical protein